jgi:hypothetical protein
MALSPKLLVLAASTRVRLPVRAPQVHTEQAEQTKHPMLLSPPTFYLQPTSQLKRRAAHLCHGELLG